VGKFLDFLSLPLVVVVVLGSVSLGCCWRWEVVVVSLLVMETRLLVANVVAWCDHEVPRFMGGRGSLGGASAAGCADEVDSLFYSKSNYMLID